MDPALFDALQRSLDTEGPRQALDALCDALRQRQDYDALFYARLMARRHELGALPIPTGPSSDVPEEGQGKFEEGIREACREVGQLYLADGKLPQAYSYLRMIGETTGVEKALSERQLREDEDAEPLIGLALYEGVHPRRGFDWVLQRYGLCSAITTLGGGQLPLSEQARHYCVGQVVRTLYEELRERLAMAIEQHDGKPPAEAAAPKGTHGVVRRLIQGRDWLFADDCYHVDFSHLSSAVQMSIDLPPGEDLEFARELCDYGQRLSPTFRTQTDPPFDDTYRDWGVYLATIADDDRDAGLAHFRRKVEANPVEEFGTGPAEILVQLLLRVDRPREALEIARKYLAGADTQRLAYTAELCRKAGDFRTLSEVAREHGNPVQFLAGLLAARSNPV